MIDEASAYLSSARAREWYRWAEDYYSDELKGGHNYVLADYERDSLTISRFNTDYQQELRIIRTYLVNHGRYIQQELSGVLREAELDSSIGSYSWLFYITFLLLMLALAIISKRQDS